MAEARRALSAERRLVELRRDRRAAAAARLSRIAAGPLWRRVRGLCPTLFVLAGELHVHRLTAAWGEVVAALRPEGVLTLDTASRLALGRGLFHGGDIHAYLASEEPVSRLKALGLINPVRLDGQSLLPPWSSPPRLLAAILPELPAWRLLPDGSRVVTDERLATDLLGAVGVRLDLFARLWAPRPAAPTTPSQPRG